MTLLIGEFARTRSSAAPFAQTPRQNTARRSDTISYLQCVRATVSFSHTRCSFRPLPKEGREGAAAGGPGGRRWRRIPPLPMMESEDDSHKGDAWLDATNNENGAART